MAAGGEADRCLAVVDNRAPCLFLALPIASGGSEPGITPQEQIHCIDRRYWGLRT